MRTSVFVALLMALAACGSSTGSPDGGSSSTPDPAWWGLGNDLCLTYTDTLGGPAQFALEVHTSSKFPGVTTYDVLEHFNGFSGTERWFQVTGDTLLLWARSDTYQPGSTGASACPDPATGCVVYTSYDPPPVYLKNDLAEGGSVETDTTASVSSGGGPQDGKHPQRFTVAALAPETLTIGGKPVPATKYTVSVTQTGSSSEAVDRVWLVPHVGLAQVWFNQENTERFQSSQTLPSGAVCGM